MHEYNTGLDETARHMRETREQLALEMRKGEYVVWDKTLEATELVEQIHTFGGILCTRRTPRAQEKA